MLSALVATGCAASPETAADRTSRGPEVADPVRRDRDIRYALAAFARTGEYGYLCHAALLGSKEAAERLDRDGLRCSYR